MDARLQPVEEFPNSKAVRKTVALESRREAECEAKCAPRRSRPLNTEHPFPNPAPPPHLPLAPRDHSAHYDRPVTVASLVSEMAEMAPPPDCRLGGEVAGSEMFDPDVRLMLEVAAGSEPAFTALVRRHQQPLLNFFVRMGARTDSEDLVQETFVRVFRYRDSYRPSARFTAFLYHLARHVWADRGRKACRHARLAAALENECHVHTQPAPVRAGESMDVQAALDRLSPKLREAIVLNVYQGLRYQEVADVLGIPLGTVKSRINLALAALKQILQ